MLFSMLGVSIVANALLSERIWHTLDRLRATPLRATGLVLGKCATPLAILLLQQVVVLGVGIAAFGLRPRHLPLLAVVGLCWAVTVLSLGAALAAVTTTPSAVSAITDITSLISTALSGALLPSPTCPAGPARSRRFLPATGGCAHSRPRSAGRRVRRLRAAGCCWRWAPAATAFAARRLWR